MTPGNPTKRRRGGQPGNRNAVGNRGGHGAPVGNQYACKNHSSVLELLREYPAFGDWIKTNAELIDSLVPSQKNSDPALYSAYLGITPEHLVEIGLERKIRSRDSIYGYVEPEEGF
jgi:hypothetical protein